MSSIDKTILDCVGGLEVNSLTHVLHMNQSDNQDDVNALGTISHSQYYEFESLKEMLEKHKDRFCILSTNIQNVSTKFSQLYTFIERLREEGLFFSAICLQEACIKDKEDLSHIDKFDDYNCIPQGKSASEKGGLIIFLHEKYKYSWKLKINTSKVWEGQFITVKGKNLAKPIILGNIYRPPKDIIRNYQTFIDEMTPVLSDLGNKNCETVVTGDTNINLLKLNERNIYSDFFDMVTNFSFYPKITLPTRFSEKRGTLIDNFFCKLNDKSIKSPAGILINKFSDHQPYFLCLNSIKCSDPPPKYVKVRQNKQANIENLINDLQSRQIQDMLNQNPSADPNKNYDVLNSVLEEAMSKHLPTKTVKYNKHKHKKSDWITYGIIKSIDFRDRLYCKLRKTKPETLEYHNIKTNLDTYNKILNKSIRLAKQIYYKSCFDLYKNDIKKTWSTINNILSRKRRKKIFSDIFRDNEEVITNKLDIANRFNEYFINIGSTLANKIKPPESKSHTDYLKIRHNQIFKFSEVQTDTIESIIDKLKPKSSFGWDGISSKLLKCIKSAIVKPITIIINQSLKTGIFPDKLKIAKVIPLFKKDDETCFSNYRPISLLPSISKVFEKAIFIQLFCYFQSNKLFYKHQYGFRTGHSTELAALELIDTLTEQLDKGEIPFVIFLDLSKAFDTLDHSILTEKLQYYGVHSTELELFKNYLSDRQQYVDIEGTKSSMQKITTGVPQGSILGPLLFIIYMNDICHASDYFDPILYADDTSLYSTLSAFNVNVSQTSCKLINAELNKINDWFKLNKLSLNAKKTKCMIFHMPQKRLPPVHFEIDGTNIEVVENFNFLGIIINKQLNWNSHIEYISGKISITIGVLNRIKHQVPLEVLVTVYNTLLLSHINYGILLWGHISKRIHKLQKKALRIITLSKYNAHTEPLFKQLNLLKVFDIHKLNKLKFYFKFINNELPQYFQELPLNANRDIHEYRTRQKHNVHMIRVNHVYAKYNIRYDLPVFINNTHASITDKINTHSLQGFSRYVKTKYVESYKMNCTIPDCYICQNM